MITTHTRKIQNPEAWLGKRVKGFANWMDFQWGDDGYCVCEWSGKLMRIEDDGGIYGEEELELATAGGYDPCYFYTQQSIYEMIRVGGRKLTTYLQ